MEGRILFAAGLLLASFASRAAVEQSQSSPAPRVRPVATDAAGRPLTDERGGRIIYTEAPEAGPIVGKPSRASTVGASSKQTHVPRMEATGISPSYRVQWRTTSFGSGIGATGFYPVDADSDGDLDIVLGGSSSVYGGNSVWSVLSFNAGNGQYEIAYQSTPGTSDPYGYSLGISALRVINSGTTPYVWLGLSDGSVEVVNLLTRETVQVLHPSSNSVTDFAVGDADNDGTDDVAVVTSTQTFLYNPQTLNLGRTLAYGGGRIALGNVDDDAEFELVYTTGNVIEVDGATVTLEWSSSISFGSRIALADIDADGREELVSADSWYLIRAWDLEAHSLKWSINADLDIAALRLIDVSGDATPEIVYGDGQWGEIHVIDAVTRTELWNIPNPEHGVTDIAVFDADGDGAREIMWGAGWTSSGPDFMYVHDLAGARALEWRSEDYSGPYSAVDIGDVDADGELELVVASYESSSGYADGVIMVFDATTNELEWRSGGGLFHGSAWTGVHDLKLLNIDADPQLEIVVGTDRLYDGALYVIDGLTHLQQSETLYDDGSPLNVLDAADLTGDGVPEVVAGNTVAHSGSPGVFLYALDPTTGAEIWKSAALSSGFGSVTDILVSDVGVPGLDIIGVSSLVHVVRWSDRRHIFSATNGYQSVTTGEVAANAGVEILAAKGTGGIDVLDGETLTLIDTHTVCSGRSINAIQMHSTNRAVLACDDELIVYDFSTRTVVDSTPAGVSSLGMGGSLIRAVDGSRSIILAGGNQAVKFIDASGNNVPQLSLQPASVHWRTPMDVQLSATDADQDALRFELVSLPSFGTATWTDAASGRLRYSAAVTALAVDSLRVRVSDGYQYSTTQTLQITLTNTVPTATATSQDLSPGATINGRFTAHDADGDPLTYSVTQQPTRGTLTFDANAGTFQYVGNGSASQIDSVTFVVSDGVSQAQSTVQFRYAAASNSGGSGGGGGGGGGGAFGALMPALLALLAGLRRRAHRARLN